MLETTNNGYQRSMWYWGAGFLIVGYFCMGRSFAYWGIPPLHLFIGEIVLGCFLFWGPVSARGRWPWVAANSLSLRRYRQLLLASIAFGVFQVFRGILLGHPVLSAIRDLAFNYYAIYFFLGVWVALNHPEFLPRLLRFAAWANGFYGILYILVLSRLAWFFPGVSQEVIPVPIFGQPMFSGAILLGLLSVEKDLRAVWPLLLLNAAVLIGMVTRGEWLAFGVGLFTWALLTRNFGRVTLGGLTILVLLGGMYLTGFQMEAPEGRGGRSRRQTWLAGSSRPLIRTLRPTTPRMRRCTKKPRRSGHCGGLPFGTLYTAVSPVPCSATDMAFPWETSCPICRENSSAPHTTFSSTPSGIRVGLGS